MKQFQLFVLLLLIIMSGCVPHSTVNLVEELTGHSYIKNYALGELKTAYVGESIAKVKDYYGDFRRFHTVTFSSDFELIGNYVTKFTGLDPYQVKINGKKGVGYSLSGIATVNGIEYNIVNFKNESQDKDEIGVLVDKMGKIYLDYILDDNHDRIMKSISANISSEDVFMIKGAVKIEFDKNALFGCNDNFELIYGGINNVSLGITYREFTLDDLARPSFFQNIVYETTAKQIRFKDIILDVSESTNEKIVYKVISDGLKDSFYPKRAAPEGYEKDYRNCEMRVSKTRK